MNPTIWRLKGEGFLIRFLHYRLTFGSILVLSYPRKVTGHLLYYEVMAVEA